MSYDWKDKFKPQGKIILTIDFGLNSKEIQALMEMIEENREKIVMVILPWASGGIGNNYDNKIVSSYAEVGIWADRLFYSIREVAPEIPVYMTVCWVDSTMKQWLEAFNAPYSGLALWNITNTNKAPLEKIYSVMSKYNENIILSGIFQCQPDTFWIPFEEAKEIHLKNSQRVKEAGFLGTILMSNRTD